MAVFLQRYVAGACRPRVRYTVGRDTENSSAKPLIEYSPVSCMRRSSFCCRSDSLGCLPLSLPRARATAMPSRVRSRISTGCQWRAIPKDLPPRSTVHGYFDLWTWDGTLARIHDALYVKCREEALREGATS